MGKAEYLIAKYVPDPFRNEPINIGVLTWVDGIVASQFLGQQSNGFIDARVAGLSKVRSTANYKQWVKTWKNKASQHTLSTSEFGQVPRTSPDFLRALSTYSSGAFILEFGGELLEDVAISGLDDVTSYLFERLVGTPDETPQYKKPDEVRDELLKDAEISFEEVVKRDFAVPLQLNGRGFTPRFSVGIGNGTIKLLGHMVPLTSHPRAVQNSARAAELLFLQTLTAGILTQDKCLALVYSKEGDESIRDSLTELALVSTIVNVNKDRRGVIQLLRSTVASAKEHT